MPQPTWLSLLIADSYGLPTVVADTIYNDVEASKSFVSIGPGDAYFYGRRTARLGDTWTFQKGGGAGDSVAQWLNRTSGAIHLSWGPGDTWIACSLEGAATWSSGLPQNVHNAISGLNPVRIAVGVDHTYVLFAGDGTVKWDVRSRYPNLDEILRNATSPIEAVALNPNVASEYFILFKNGIWRGSLPAPYRNSVTEVLREDLQRKASEDMEIAKFVMQSQQQQAQYFSNFILHLNWG